MLSFQRERIKYLQSNNFFNDKLLDLLMICFIQPNTRQRFLMIQVAGENRAFIRKRPLKINLNKPLWYLKSKNVNLETAALKFRH